MIGEWEIWACAATLRRRHGDEAARVIDERVATLEDAGDTEGVRTFRRIRERLVVLADDAPGAGVLH